MTREKGVELWSEYWKSSLQAGIIIKNERIYIKLIIQCKLVGKIVLCAFAGKDWEYFMCVLKNLNKK